MQTLVIDGYNVIHAIPQIEELLDESLQAARDALVRLLVEFKGSRRDVEKIYVVFDGRGESGDEEITAAPGINVVYTHSHKEADEKILEIIQDSKRPASVTVVSNDNFIYNNSRVHGAFMKSVEEFCGMFK